MSFLFILLQCNLVKSQATKYKLDVKKSSAGLGLFAGEEIKKGEKVIEYIGEKITAVEADKRGGKYLFEISSKWTIDGTNRKNIARYVNHGCDPLSNCEAEVRGGRVFILSKRAIEPGEELLYDYGEEYFDEHLKPVGCQCRRCAL